jgi:hypothetical protein
MKLKIYSDASHAEQQHWIRYLVHPLKAFWGDGTDEWPQYEPDFAFYRDVFELVSDINAAEICVLPMTWNYYTTFKKQERAAALAQQAAEAGKKVMIWVDGDQGIRQPFKNALVLQNAAHRSRKRADQIVRPGFARDLVKEYFRGIPPIRSQKAAKPLVGFCGQANSSRVSLIAARNLQTQLAYVLRMTDYEPIRPIKPHLLLRQAALNHLSSCPDVEDNFIIRKQSTTRMTKNNAWREQFVQNMHDTEYTLCIRGTANYSIRFFETLAMGRIPVFVDTDCALPLEHLINWKAYCIWVDASELSSIGEHISEFHHRLSPHRFVELQRACRELWVKYLSSEGFHRHLCARIRCIL